MSDPLDYPIPSWSSLPSHHFYLQVIKDGAVIGNLLLPQKQFILFGKQEDVCDVTLQNPMISRRHAIVQFKQGDPQPHLYDLDSTHGVFVNNTKLPRRIYHRVNCFDTIQFGGSNKEYLLRCKELERQKDQEESPDQTEFQKVMNQNRDSISKSELKQKYLDLLHHDPYHNSNHESRKFQGKAEGGNGGEKDVGVSWGMSDQAEMYNYRNEQEYQLEPDLLRRLPLNDQRIIDKINQLQEVLNKYHEVQGELRDIVNREKREYGLEDKVVTKKENLEKKLMETQEQLEKHENYIRVHLFGEETTRTVGNEKRAREVDTFEGDEFYDRTLEKNEGINLDALRNEHFENSTEDYYKLKNRLEELLKKQQELNKRLMENCTEMAGNVEEMDEYQLYLYESEKRLRRENYEKLKVEIGSNNELVEITRGKLNQIQPSNVDQPIQFEQDIPLPQTVTKRDNPKQGKDDGISHALRQLQRLNKQEEEVGDDKELFRVYQKKQKLKSAWKRDRDEVDPQEDTIEEGIKKKPPRVLPHRREEEELEDFEDLTKFD